MDEKQTKWNGVPSITARAHWLRYRKNGQVEILQWSDLCQKWFAFGVSGSDGPERIASEYDYLGPAFAPGVISTEPCGFCGMRHSNMCPHVKAFEYHHDGSMKRVEFKTATDYGWPNAFVTVTPDATYTTAVPATSVPNYAEWSNRSNKPDRTTDKPWLRERLQQIYEWGAKGESGPSDELADFILDGLLWYSALKAPK